MDISKVKSHWDAYIYDQQEDQSDDIDFLRSVIGIEPKSVLEVACGAGRILAPLARDGHSVTGFDLDEEMLSFVAEKPGSEYARYYRADAVTEDWGRNFDVVVEGANLLINIISKGSYAEAQQLFITKAANALKSGGILYLDFNFSQDPEKFFSNNSERVVFEGYDDCGVYGVYSILSSKYERKTQLLVSETQTVLTLTDGSKHIISKTTTKYIPAINEIHRWLRESGFKVQMEFGDYKGNPITPNSCRCIIVAERR